MYLHFHREEKNINRAKAYLPHELASHGEINLTSSGPQRSVVFIGLGFHCCKNEAALILYF